MGILRVHRQISVEMVLLLGHEQHIILVNIIQMLMHCKDCSSSSMKHEV
jgi:hypothetical protein